MDSNFIQTVITSAFTPVINFLKQWGVWDTLVAFWNAMSDLCNAIASWFGLHLDLHSIGQFLFAFLKFAFSIIITLFQVLTDVAQWLLQYFK